MKARWPSVSVVIPMYNAEAWIRETLATVVEQTYEVEECIVVDDGSTDESPRIVRDFMSDSPLPIRLMEGPNSGVSAARNTGIEASTSELVALLDADDLWNHQKLEKQVEFLETSGATMCTCGYEIFDSETGRGLGAVQFRDPARAIRRWLALEANGLLVSSTALFRKGALDQTGGFCPDLWLTSDLEFVWRLNESGFIVTDPRIMVGYRSHPGQMHKVLEDTIDNSVRLFDIVFSVRQEVNFERRCRANLDAHAGYNLLRKGKISDGLRFLQNSLRKDPRRVVTLPVHVLTRVIKSWLNTQIGRRRFFDPIRSR